MSDPAKREKFDLPAFLGRNSKDIRFPEIKLVAQALKSRYPKVVGIGYCYGGWAQSQLGADPYLIDAIPVAHPSGLTKEEIDNVKVPVQILAPETDPLFTQELEDYANKTIPAQNVPCAPTNLSYGITNMVPRVRRIRRNNNLRNTTIGEGVTCSWR
jgi:dienelactone hydrolase